MSQEQRIQEELKEWGGTGRVIPLGFDKLEFDEYESIIEWYRDALDTAQKEFSLETESIRREFFIRIKELRDKRGK